VSFTASLPETASQTADPGIMPRRDVAACSDLEHSDDQVPSSHGDAEERAHEAHRDDQMAGGGRVS
jgi:hypothetical protein